MITYQETQEIRPQMNAYISEGRIEEIYTEGPYFRPEKVEELKGLENKIFEK